MTTFTPPPAGDSGTPALSASQLALLRQLTGDQAEPYQRTDLELAQAAALTPGCPQTWDARLGEWTPSTPRPDLYETAARLWEDRATLETITGTAADEPARIASERNGDLSVSYAGAGKATGGAVLSPDRMRAIARSLRRKSCNGGPAQTVRVRTEAGLYETPIRGPLYPSNLVN